MSESPEHALIAVFDDATRAEHAIHDVMAWDEANDDIKFGAVGLLTREGGTWGQGEIKTRNFSSRNTGKGAKIGMGLGALAAVLSGGLTLIPTAIGGVAAGAAAGSLSRKGLGLTNEELDRLSKDLDGGRAAVLVVCDEGDVSATTDYLVARGGKVDSHAVEDSWDWKLDAAAADAATPTPSTVTPEPGS